MTLPTPSALLRQPNFAALVVLVWLLAVLGLLLQHWAQTAETLLDADDAMRLVQMRAWLAGQGWFDLHEPRLQPPAGYESHWSRLVDAGLAGLFLLFKSVTGPEAGERLMRAWWPLLWLLPAMAGMVAIAWRIAGREAAMVALLLALAGGPAYRQFVPGRIDHHNVMIALTVLAVAATVWSDRRRWCAPAAGALGGAALAIGLDSLPYLAACGAVFAARAVFDRDASVALREYGLSLAAATFIAFAVSVGPDHFARSQCDTLAINTASAVMCGGLLLALIGWLSHAHAATRAVAVIAAGCASAAVLLLFDKRCIGGPFALVDPAILPILQDYAREMQPLLSVFRTNSLAAAGFAAFPVAALCAIAVLVREATLRRDFGFLAAASVFLVAAGTMLVLTRAYSYAIWLGMPLVAVAALRVFAMFELKTLPVRLLAGLLLTPLVLSFGATAIARSARLEDKDGLARPEIRDCLQTAAYRPLAQLPPGLVAADIGLGPYLLALTPHSVLAAPYHRLSTGIVAVHRAFAAPPETARGILASAKVAYVVTCGSRPPDGLAAAERGQSLWGRLQAGAVPGWLEAVPDTRPFAVYRVKP